MNEDLFTQLKENVKQSKLTNQNKRLDISNGAFFNIEVTDRVLKKNKPLLKRYNTAIKTIAKNIDVYKPIIDLIQMTSFTELYYINKIQLAKLIFTSNMVTTIDPKDFDNLNCVPDRISEFLDETDKNHNLISATLILNMEFLNTQYSNIVNNQ